MSNLARSPLLILASSFVLMALSARIGMLLRRRPSALGEEVRHDLHLIDGAVLTLLGLIIGFTFSMATNRYDLRKNYEEAEANAIGTEYVRADFLPASEASKFRALLKDYLDQRILFYESHDEHELQMDNGRTAQLQSEPWSTVHVLASPQQTPVMALVVSGMNDVLNS